MGGYVLRVANLNTGAGLSEIPEIRCKICHPWPMQNSAAQLQSLPRIMPLYGAECPADQGLLGTGVPKAHFREGISKVNLRLGIGQLTSAAHFDIKSVQLSEDLICAVGIARGDNKQWMTALPQQSTLSCKGDILILGVTGCSQPN